MFFSKFTIKILIFLLFLGSNLNLMTNEPSKKLESGIFYGAVSSINNFNRLGDTVNCCPEEYEAGSGFSLIIPINYYHKIYDNFYIVSGLSYQYDDMIFSFVEEEPVRGENALIKHYLNSRKNLFGLNLGLSYSVKKVHLNASLTGLYSISSVYDQSETLISRGAFDTLGTRVRNEFESLEADLTRAFHLRFFTSIAYSVKFKENYEFLPNIGFQMDLLSQHQDNNWLNSGIYFGLTFRYLMFRNNVSPIEPKIN